MKINSNNKNYNFKALLSKNIIPLIARAKGSCPLHKKPLLYDAIKSIETIFPYNTVSLNNKEIHLAINSPFQNHIVLAKITGNAVDDVRAIAAELEYQKIGIRKYSPMTEKQKTALENYKKKWGAFILKR